MNNLQIFTNNEFGEIRTITIDNEPYFVGKDIAVALGYANTRKAIYDNVDVDEKVVTKVTTPGGMQDTIVINESGMYALVFGSSLPNARKFRKWVTSEVLPSIRKDGMYSLNNSNNILERFHQFNGLVIDELNGVNARIDKLEDETIVNSKQVKKIKDKANAKAVMALGGKDSICYQDSSIRAVVYANLWNDYKDYLGITSYSDTRKIDYDKGIDFISKWQPNGRTMRILEGVV